MPKRRDSDEIVSEDDSGSNSSVEVKKPKKTKKSDENGQPEKKEEKPKDFRGELGKNKKVTISNFRGTKYVDIREWYVDKSSNEHKPGKKGISLDAAQWEKLKSFVDEVDAALKA